MSKPPMKTMTSSTYFEAAEFHSLAEAYDARDDAAADGTEEANEIVIEIVQVGHKTWHLAYYDFHTAELLGFAGREVTTTHEFWDGKDIPF